MNVKPFFNSMPAFYVKDIRGYPEDF